jgi:hypothetical protein
MGFSFFRVDGYVLHPKPRRLRMHTSAGSIEPQRRALISPNKPIRSHHEKHFVHLRCGRCRLVDVGLRSPSTHDERHGETDGS